MIIALKIQSNFKSSNYNSSKSKCLLKLNDVIRAWNEKKMYSPCMWYATMIDESYYMKVLHSQIGAMVNFVHIKYFLQIETHE